MLTCCTAVVIFFQCTGAVDLTRMRLHTRHVPNLQRFTALKRLNLAHNKLSTLSDVQFSCLVSLEQLDLHDNTLA